MPVAHDADPWVRPPLGGHETSWRYGVARDGGPDDPEKSSPVDGAQSADARGTR